MRSVWRGRRGRCFCSSVPVEAGAAAARVLRAEGRREVGREERGRTGAGWAVPGSGSAAPAEASREAAARPPRGRQALVSAGRRAAQGPGLPRGPSPGVSAARGCTWARPRRRLTCARALGRREGAASSSRDSFIVFLTSAFGGVRRGRAGRPAAVAVAAELAGGSARKDGRALLPGSLRRPAVRGFPAGDACRSGSTPGLCPRGLNCRGHRFLMS